MRVKSVVYHGQLNILLHVRVTVLLEYFDLLSLVCNQRCVGGKKARARPSAVLLLIQLLEDKQKIGEHLRLGAASLRSMLK